MQPSFGVTWEGTRGGKGRGQNLKPQQQKSEGFGRAWEKLKKANSGTGKKGRLVAANSALGTRTKEVKKKSK